MTNQKQKLAKAIEVARSNNFGYRAIAILCDAAEGPVNPYAHFGGSLRRSWSYGYFDRLHKAGLLEYTKTPAGRRGFRWYVLA